MDKANMKAVLQKYTMIIVLILVTLFFTWKTGGKILLPQNISNLIGVVPNSKAKPYINY